MTYTPVAHPRSLPRSLPRFGVVDIETSGLSTRRHRILQIGLVTVAAGEIADQWSTLVRLRWPWQRVGPRRVHGLTRHELRGAPTLRSALTELAGRLDGSVFTAHNADFDAAFLERAARREHVALPLGPRVCTLRLSRGLDPERQLSHRLGDICGRYGVALDRPHDALHDAIATASVLPHLLAEHGVDSGESLAALYVAR
ncbi:MAG: 3'-5' exonuclease [Ilumatobacteraceae bacterium]